MKEKEGFIVCTEGKGKKGREGRDIECVREGYNIERESEVGVDEGRLGVGGASRVGRVSVMVTNSHSQHWLS